MVQLPLHLQHKEEKQSSFKFLTDKQPEGTKSRAFVITVSNNRVRNVPFSQQTNERLSKFLKHLYNILQLSENA